MTTCGRCIGEMLNAALSSIGTCNSRVPQEPRLARMRYLPVHNFIFQLHTEQEVERENAPCADPADARSFAEQIAHALKAEGWIDDGTGAYLSVLDEDGREIFRQPL